MPLNKPAFVEAIRLRQLAEKSTMAESLDLYRQSAEAMERALEELEQGHASWPMWHRNLAAAWVKAGCGAEAAAHCSMFLADMGCYRDRYDEVMGLLRVARTMEAMTAV